MFNEPLCDTFLVSEGAKAGKATMLENIVIENPQFNDEDFTATIGFSIRAQYCAGLKIIRPRGFGSKMPYAADSSAGDFIKMINVIEPYIEDPCMTHGAYYGLTIAGWSRGVKSYGGTMTDVRHAVSLVQVTQSVVGTPGRVQKYGQPQDVLIHGMTARNTSLSSFDTHDTGLNVRFESCSAYAAGDDGFQFRTHKVKAIDCVANGSLNDGFSHNDLLPSGAKVGAQDCELINCRALLNGRAGANFRYNRGVIRGGEYISNGSPNCRPALVTPPTSAPAGQGATASGACGILINGGIIDGARIEGNAGSGGANGSAIVYGDTTAAVTMRPLELRSLTAPASALQTGFIWLADSSLDFGLITLAGGCQINGYGDTLFNNLGTIDNKPPMSFGGNHITTDATQRRGQATLVGGSAFVANTAVRNKTAAAFGEAIISKIALNRATRTGIPGALSYTINDQVGFTIRSEKFVEPTRTNVIRNNTNVGVTNGAIGSGGVLPTNWSINALSGLTLTIVGTGTETGPGGGTQNYIDLRLSGTASATINAVLLFDTANNAQAAASAGQTWATSFGTKLVAGSMTGIAPFSLLLSYTSGGAAVDSLFTAISVTSTPVRQARIGALTGAAAFARAGLQMTVTNGTTVDATIRIYMPQLEQASDASAPIATSSVAVTRTADTTNADNSVVEWVVSL